MSQIHKTRNTRFQFSLGLLMLGTVLWAAFLGSVRMVGLLTAILVAGYLAVGWCISKTQGLIALKLKRLPASLHRVPL